MRQHLKWQRPLRPATAERAGQFVQPTDAGEQPEVDRDAVARFLSIATLANLEIPPETKFLGDVLTTGRRVFLVGTTGLGKSQLAHAIGAGIATGRGFLGWTCDRPARVLVIDGEMSKQTLKTRARAMMRRVGVKWDGENLVMFAADRADEFAKLFPQLGKFEPLNLPAGRQFLIRLIQLMQPEVVVFDNVMSLTVGDQKDEQTWKQAEPLIKHLTALGIAQLWIDHAGWNASRQYGAAAKAWLMDAVGIMTAQADNGNGKVSFKLSFNPPGKARHRSEENEDDYSDRAIMLCHDEWSSTPLGQAKDIADAVIATDRRKKMLAAGRKLLAARGTEYTVPDTGEIVRAAKVGEWRGDVLDTVEEDERNKRRHEFDRDLEILEHDESKGGQVLTDGEGKRRVFWLPSAYSTPEEEDC